ncbi:MAG TPA: uroporphyrinogen decarboxylase family protein, partial [Alphaproteobacteria bacterium]|nr:uroporphyrinogen decarboxylase family protein [Alphaproteobacteria bacterium]
IPHLIDIGVDALNPVQVTARNMEPERLKEEFGDRICFWGGINTQRILPFGTAEEVAAETRRVIDILGKGGGYVLNSVHNIQAEVPPANVVAMFETGVNHRYH